MAELAGVLVGNYFLLECMAREGMVETYRARPTDRGGVDVVLRLFRPEFPDPTAFRDHFTEEVEKLWRCHHESIQPLLEFGTGDELLFCATLLLEGETLAQYIERSPGQTLPLSFVMNLFAHICSALHYAHERNIVHGNIQPTSILLGENGQVLLTHFGMRRAYSAGEPLASTIREGNAAYTAPEQVLGMIQPASDIYALGVLLYRLLGGVLPYHDQDPGETALLHANETLPSLRTLRPDISEALEAVVEVALAKSPDDRFATPLAMAEALRRASEPKAQHVIASTPERRIPVRAQRTHVKWSRVASFLLVCLLLTGLVGASFFVFSLPRSALPPLAALGWLRPSMNGGSTRGNSSSTSRKSPGRPQGIGPTPPTNTTPEIGSNSSATATPTSKPTPTGTGTVSTTPTATPQPQYSCASGTLSLDGSQSLALLLSQFGNDYMALCPALAISLAEDGSRTALNALQQQQIDAAASDLTARASRNLVDHPIAAMVYAVIVSPDVQISNVSSATLQAIYAGSITNWSQVGGPNEAITVYQRPAVDTVTAIFRAFVLGGQTEHVKGYRLKKGWVQAVAQTPGAISYVPLVEAQAANVPVLAIDGVQPGISTLQQGSYTFWSVEHLYTASNGTSQFQSYLAFLNSTPEAAVFAQNAAIPVNMVAQTILATHLPGPEI